MVAVGGQRQDGPVRPGGILRVAEIRPQVFARVRVALAGDYDGRLKVVKVDVDKSTSTAAKFGVMSVPTVLIVRDGAVRDQLVGLLSACRSYDDDKAYI